jgi:hypothetical protein
MEAAAVELAARVQPASLLGYLNFSDGRPDPKFQRALNEAYAYVVERGDSTPWQTLRNWLFRQCDLLQQSGNAAFKDTTQGRAVMRIGLGGALTAYREHHADLLAHQTEAVLFNPFFLARVFEAVLAQGPPWEEEERIIRGALARLNDFVGYRPIAVLESRPQTDYYPHEKFRPVPLYLRGVGGSHGPYKVVVEKAMEVLQQTDPNVLHRAGFDPNQLDELALDPRAYDHGHPANRRPNYLFGEWDPHLIDRQGRYRRFVVRQAVLDALVESVAGQAPGASVSELAASSFVEAATVLAGTILMAAGMSGEGPAALDSTVKLANLVPRIAQYRDEFYQGWIDRIPGELGDRLRADAKRVRQPFGGIRQHLNHVLARQRAVQLQERRLAMLFAELGFPEASRQRARRIPTASLRFLGEIRVQQTTAELNIHAGHLRGAAALLPEIERRIERGIDCGALTDPWNILGYQGLYPLFHSKEDSVHDSRNEELIEAMTLQFDLYARLLAAAAFAGDTMLHRVLSEGIDRLATWWDRFATYTVSDVPRLGGGERMEAAQHVADTLVRWRAWKQDPAGTEIQFWRGQSSGISSTAAYAQVLEALLREKDWNAALSLLMAWLSEAELIALEEGNASFAELAERWIDGVTVEVVAKARAPLLQRFLELLEVNASDLWDVPQLTQESKPGPAENDKEFASAYEGMSFRDSADDGTEGSIAGGEGPADFLLEEESDRIENRLNFLAATARFWRKIARPGAGIGPEWDGWSQTLSAARRWEAGLLEFMDAVLKIEVPAPVGSTEDVIEYNHRREVRDHLAEIALATRIEVSQAVWMLAAASADEGAIDGATAARGSALLRWEPAAIAMERALALRDPVAVRRILPELATLLEREPLLFVPLAEDGKPRETLRARTAMAFFESLFNRLPRLGLLRETFHLLRLAKSMELNGPPDGPRKSDFDRLFRTALRKVVEVLLDAAVQWDDDRTVGTVAFTNMLREIAKSFLDLWSSHSQMLRLSTLEAITSDDEWRQLRDFIKKYGRPLFTSHFMILGNLRGILQFRSSDADGAGDADRLGHPRENRGVGAWLDSLRESKSDEGLDRLLEDLDNAVLDRNDVTTWIERVLHTIEEHYEEYRDYNTTTTQSDYGDNLAVLIDFLRLKVQYDRLAWRMRPLALAHEVLCRKGHYAIAERWRENIGENLRPKADELLAELARKEEDHALKLRTIRDRIEERFVQPLLLDRLISLVEPAARAAREGQGEAAPAFLRLEEQLRPFVDNPTGVGLDVPHWLRKFENEVERVREQLDQPKSIEQAPVALKFEDLQEQIEQWDNPLTGGG